MTSAGTVANRIVLLGGAAMLLGGGVVLLAAGLRSAGALPAPAEDVLVQADGLVAWSGAWGLDIPGAGFVPLWALAGLAAAVLLVVLLLAFLLTRRPRRERTLLRLAGEGGTTTVDRSVAEQLLAAPLADRADVLAARVTSRKAGREIALGLVVTPRPGAALGQVLAAADAVVQEWDAVTGTRMPVVVHIADRGWRELFRSRQRMRRSLVAGQSTAAREPHSTQTSTPTVGVV
ncbi:hypothetical protein [Microbacterium paraoxydans]|uniref:Alkaline shock response membrane anchor protein AmaP n=1 Tax=Microbacterium paraoxydans TaxID=199592 RepID=A0A1H1VBF7_9MICO|nr:hypothetical protein [Microbacterium paraoxydans]SDS82013.1 hypothetical protein SAMN04489809_2764 [Microbacterium paraoxydans]